MTTNKSPIHALRGHSQNQLMAYALAQVDMTRKVTHLQTISDPFDWAESDHLNIFITLGSGICWQFSQGEPPYLFIAPDNV